MTSPSDFGYPSLSEKAKEIYENLTPDEEKNLQRLFKWVRPALSIFSLPIMFLMLGWSPVSGGWPRVVNIFANVSVAVVTTYFMQCVALSKILKSFLCDTEFAIRMGHAPNKLPLYSFWSINLNNFVLAGICLCIICGALLGGVTSYVVITKYFRLSEWMASLFSILGLSLGMVLGFTFGLWIAIRPSVSFKK